MLVDGLSAAEARKQLHLAFRHMDCCLRALRGEDVKPVDMIDTDESIAQELFWECVKCSSEINVLNDILDSGDEWTDYALLLPADFDYYSTCT